MTDDLIEQIRDQLYIANLISYYANVHPQPQVREEIESRLRP